MGNLKEVTIKTENSMVWNTNENISMAGGKLYGGKIKGNKYYNGKY